MMRWLSWVGWGSAGCMLLAILIVTHALTRVHHAVGPSTSLRSGVTFENLGGAGGGTRLLVTSLRTGGPAQIAGLRVGDRIEDVDGHPVPSIDAFDRDLSGRSRDDIDLRVHRGAALLDIHMRRGEGTK